MKTMKSERAEPKCCRPVRYYGCVKCQTTHRQGFDACTRITCTSRANTDGRNGIPRRTKCWKGWRRSDAKASRECGANTLPALTR